MRRRDYLLLGLLGLLVILPVAAVQSTPGYMDADYYFLGGRQIALEGRLEEPILWNYLDDPAGLPHPSHGYWMPLASIIAAIGIKLTGTATFFWARLPFLLISALIAPLTAALCYSFTKSRTAALVAGVLATLSGFYLPFMTTSDTFGVYMVLGGLFFLTLETASQSPYRGRHPLALGLIVALMHLARADGFLWLLIGALGIFGMYRRTRLTTDEARSSTSSGSLVRMGVLFLSGYLLIAGPWFVRNVMVFGTPLAPGGSRALWLTNYDQLFAYPASNLTLASWMDVGLEELLQHRIWALRLNLANAVVVQGFIILAPLMAIGLWKGRDRLSPPLGALAWLLTLAVMTLIFPFPGGRGGFFHSGAALQPLLWAVVPLGLNAFVALGVSRRGWIARQANIAFGAGLVLLSLVLTVVAVQRRVIGDQPGDIQWDRSAVHYAELESTLQDRGAGTDEVVLVNNPPGFYIATGRPAIAIPNETPDVLLAVAERYKARYVLLEVNHPRPLDPLYEDPQNASGFRVLAEVGETVILRVE